MSSILIVGRGKGKDGVGSGQEGTKWMGESRMEGKKHGTLLRGRERQDRALDWGEVDRERQKWKEIKVRKRRRGLEGRQMPENREGERRGWREPERRREAARSTERTEEGETEKESWGQSGRRKYGMRASPRQ